MEIIEEPKGLKFLFKGKIYDGHRWVYGELWLYEGTDKFEIVELEGV